MAPVVNVNINNGGGSRAAGGFLDWISPQFGIPAWIWYPALSAISAAALYYGSEYVKSILTSYNGRGAVNAQPPQGGPTGLGPYLYGLFSGASHAVSNGAQATSDGVASGLKTVGHYLNPWTYFSATPDGSNTSANAIERMAREFFIANQTDPARANENYYPHTLKDPQMSYIQQWRVAVFGLSQEAEEARQATLQVYRDNVQHINRPSELGPTAPGLTVGGLRVDEVPSGARTPTGTGVGIFGAGFDERVATSIHEVNRGQAIKEALEGLVTKGKNAITTAYEKFTTQDVEDTQSVWDKKGEPATLNSPAIASEGSIDLADRRAPTPPIAMEPLSDMDKLRFENPRTAKDVADAAIYAKKVQASASSVQASIQAASSSVQASVKASASDAQALASAAQAGPEGGVAALADAPDSEDDESVGGWQTPSLKDEGVDSVFAGGVEYDNSLLDKAIRLFRADYAATLKARLADLAEVPGEISLKHIQPFVDLKDRVDGLAKMVKDSIEAGESLDDRRVKALQEIENIKKEFKIIARHYPEKNMTDIQRNTGAGLSFKTAALNVDLALRSLLKK